MHLVRAVAKLVFASIACVTIPTVRATPVVIVLAVVIAAKYQTAAEPVATAMCVTLVKRLDVRAILALNASAKLRVVINLRAKKLLARAAAARSSYHSLNDKVT